MGLFGFGKKKEVVPVEASVPSLDDAPSPPLPPMPEMPPMPPVTQTEVDLHLPELPDLSAGLPPLPEMKPDMSGLPDFNSMTLTKPEIVVEKRKVNALPSINDIPPIDRIDQKIEAKPTPRVETPHDCFVLMQDFQNVGDRIKEIQSFMDDGAKLMQVDESLMKSGNEIVESLQENTATIKKNMLRVHQLLFEGM